MKKLIILVIALIATTVIWAKPNAEITKYYIGTLTGSAYDISNSDNYINTSWRAGLEMKFQTDIGEISGFSVFNSSLNIFSWTWNPVKYLYVGHGGRPVTYLHRAHPVSPGSHFEPRSLGIIPGSAPNVKICLPTKNSSYHFGVWQYKNSDNEKMPEINFGSSINIGSKTKLMASGYCNEEVYGGVITFKKNRGQIMVYANSDETITNIINFYFSETGAIYSDFVWENEEVAKYELGATWDWTIDTGKQPVNGLIGLGYVYQTYNQTKPMNSLNLYFMAFINK